MNDPAVKMALTISILAGAVFIAIVFRPVFLSTPGAGPELSAPLALQPQKPPPIPRPAIERNPEQAFSARENFTTPSASQQSPTILSPLGPAEPVPNLPPRYPVRAQVNSASWGVPISAMPKVARSADGPKSHKIVDGDTLGNLAARYLGSANRANEIFEANRDVLSDPELLTIGVELHIPAR
jgi:nucleoid-associated protein YgaU